MPRMRGTTFSEKNASDRPHPRCKLPLMALSSELDAQPFLSWHKSRKGRDRNLEAWDYYEWPGVWKFFTHWRFPGEPGIPPSKKLNCLYKNESAQMTYFLLIFKWSTEGARAFTMARCPKFQEIEINVTESHIKFCRVFWLGFAGFRITFVTFEAAKINVCRFMNRGMRL